MSVYVVLTSGVVINYPAGRHIRWEATPGGIAKVYDSTFGSGNLIATVPAGAAVGFGEPTIHPTSSLPQKTLEGMLEVVAESVDRIDVNCRTHKWLVKLKKRLRGYNSRSCKWKAWHGKIPSVDSGI